MQKAASIERKIILKEQRNLIKHQLSTDTMLSKMKVNSARERRLSGPLKVIQSHSESIRSETSISKRSSSERDVYSITSHTHSIVSKVSEISGEEAISRHGQSDGDSGDLARKLAGEACRVPISQMKKTLLMREAALQKRRKAAEELLQWHKKLLEEEKRITELESTANAIISHIPNNVSASADVADKYRFKGKQLNQLWFNLTGCEEKKFAEDKIYPMSQLALERFCKSAREYSSKTKKILKRVSDSEINSEFSEARTDDSVSENVPGQNDALSASTRTGVNYPRKKISSRNEIVPTATINDYASDFDVESIQDILSNKDMDVVNQNINQLIDNFSKIEADISSLGINQALKSSEYQESDESLRSGSDVEVSVIETAKTSGSEKIQLKLGSKDKKSSSSKTLSAVEEINKSTRDTLSKNEEVLLRLSQIEDRSKKSSLTDESLSPSEETDNLRRSDGSLISKLTEDKLSTDASRRTSSSKKSEIEKSMPKLSQADDKISTEKTALIEEATKDNLSKTEEILEKLSLGDGEINTDTSSDKKSSLIEEAVNETKENLSKTEEILERLSLAESRISTDVSPNKKSTLIEESRTTNEATDNLSKSEEILERLSPTNKISITASSKKQSSLIEDSQATSDNLSKTEEILERLSQVGDKISTDASSINKLLIEEDSPSANEAKGNLNKAEEIIERLSQLEDKVSTDVSSDKKSSAVEENVPSAEEKIDLNENEEISQRLNLVEGKIDDVSSNKKSSTVSEEMEVFGEDEDNLSKTEEILSQAENQVSTIASEICSNEKPPAVEENRSVASARSLNEPEKLILELDQVENKDSSEVSSKEEGEKSVNGIDDLSSSKKLAELQQNNEASSESSLILEENQTASKIGKVSEVADKINTELSEVEAKDEIPTDSMRNSSRVLGSLSYKEDFVPKESEVDKKRIGSESSEDVSESLKETDIDEELSVDEELKSEKASKSVQLGVEIIEISDDREAPEVILISDDDAEENVIEIKDDEELSNTNKESPKLAQKLKDACEIQEVIAVEDKDAEEKLSSEENIRNKELAKEPLEDSEGVEQNKDESEDGSITSSTASRVTTKLDLSYGVIERKTSSKEDLSQQTTSDVCTDSQDKSQVSASLHTDSTPSNKEQMNSYEEKEQDSLSSSASSSPHVSIGTENEKSAVSEKSKSNIEEKSAKNGAIDVRRRVSEIMADASQTNRGEKSPRVQDLYVTTYDLVSPANSPELGSPIEEQKIIAAKSIFGTEAEEIRRMQLAIEEEIKLITEQQQKEQIPPYMYVREIPNKPPPPYTPPSSLPPLNIITIIPTAQEIDEITKYSAKILHKAYLSSNLDNISISENTLGLVCKNITKECYKFVFDLCKEISKQHYKQFEKEKCVSWLQVRKKPQLAVVKPLDVNGLEKHLSKNLKELFEYEKPDRRENAIIKWSRKKRDYVDEILVMESQSEETQWTNYDKDELLVMNAVTNEIMNMLLKETGEVFSKILSKRTYLY